MFPQRERATGKRSHSGKVTGREKAGKERKKLAKAGCKGMSEARARESIPNKSILTTGVRGKRRGMGSAVVAGSHEPAGYMSACTYCVVPRAGVAWGSTAAYWNWNQWGLVTRPDSLSLSTPNKNV